MRRMLREYGVFLREVRNSFHTTGALIPSGRFLARAMTSELVKKNGCTRILEAGAGTGALTREILQHVGTEDHLDLVEYSHPFVTLLGERFEKEERFRRVADQTRILHMALQDLPGEGVYDYVISGLPLNNFSPQLVQDVFDCFRRLIVPGGVLTFFEYLWVRGIKRFVAPRSEVDRLTRVGTLLAEHLKHFEFRREKVWMNCPPALVHHLRLGR